MNVDKPPLELKAGMQRMGEAHPTQESKPENVPSEASGESGGVSVALTEVLPQREVIKPVKRPYRKNPDIPTGRPLTDYENLIDADTTDEIMERIATGESVRQICQCDDMPSDRIFYRVLLNSETFRNKYALAKEFQADKMNEDVIDIANDGTNDWMERENAKTGAAYPVLNEEHIARSKLRIETMKWVMGKAKPKKYGDQPAQTNVNVGVQVAVMSDEKRQRLMEKKQAAIARRAAQLSEKTIPHARTHTERETI